MHRAVYVVGFRDWAEGDGDIKLFKTNDCGRWRGMRESSRKLDKHGMQLAVSVAQTFSSGTPPLFFFFPCCEGRTLR